MSVTVVVGGQAGSEGKGAVCARLHGQRRFDYAVRIGGSNAGHSVVDKTGRKWALRHVPVAAVVDPETTLVIAAGSEVDVPVLMEEIETLEAVGYRVRKRLLIDETATLVDPAAVHLEDSIRTGTTGKGVGGARARRALRQAALVTQHADLAPYLADTQRVIRHAAWQGQDIMIEGTQGYWLGSHAGYYPYSTSGDCRAQDFMAAVGLPPMNADVVVTLRMHPIRIAGDSGPMAEETTWEELGVEPEFTTVTKKMRRVGKWSPMWATQSVAANGGSRCRIALMFTDYVWPEMKGRNGFVENLRDLPCAEFVENVQGQTGARVVWLGTGPSSMLTVAS